MVHEKQKHDALMQNHIVRKTAMQEENFKDEYNTTQSELV